MFVAQLGAGYHNAAFQSSLRFRLYLLYTKDIGYKVRKELWMSWNEGSIMSITLNQTLLDQKLLNKLFYRVVQKAVDLIIEEALDALAEWIVDAFIALQISELEHSTQVFLDETDGLGYYVASYAQPGTIVGDPALPSFAAYGMTKLVESRITRPGGLRVAGASESSVTGNNLTPGAIVALLNLGAVLAVPIAVQDSGLRDFVVEPVVVGRLPDGSLDLSKINPVTQVTNPRLTSQVSRRKKYE